MNSVIFADRDNASHSGFVNRAQESILFIVFLCGFILLFFYLGYVHMISLYNSNIWT